MTPPSSQELHYFLEVAQTLNISRAAERLGVTQPTLSVSLQRLEANLGAKLFLRGKSGMKLTKTGHRFLVQSKKIFEEWRRLKDEALRDENETRGIYSIGVHPSVANYTLPLFLKDLLKRFEQLEIRLVHDLSRKISEAVVQFEVDFGIVINPFSHPDLVIRELGVDEVTLFMSSAVESLKKMSPRILIYDPNLSQAQWILSKLKRNSVFEGDFRRLESTNLEVIANLTKSGVGIGLLPGRVAANFGLRALEGVPVFKDKICLIYRKDAQASKGAKELMSAMGTAMSAGF